MDPGTVSGLLGIQGPPRVPRPVAPTLKTITNSCREGLSLVPVDVSSFSPNTHEETGGLGFGPLLPGETTPI